MTVRRKADWLGDVDALVPDNVEGEVSVDDVRSLLIDFANSADFGLDRVREFRFGGQVLLGDNAITGWALLGAFDDASSTVLGGSATTLSLTRSAGGPRLDVPIALECLRLTYRANLDALTFDWSPVLFHVDRTYTVGSGGEVDHLIYHRMVGDLAVGSWISITGSSGAFEVEVDLEGYVVPAGHTLFFGVACPDSSHDGGTDRSIQIHEGAIVYRELEIEVV